MQINRHYHGDRFGSLDAMFDPRQNVDYAARFLADLKRRHVSWSMAVAGTMPARTTIRPEALYLPRDRQSRRHRLRRMDASGAELLHGVTPQKGLGRYGEF